MAEAPHQIWCDEAGSNGPDMLHEPEPYFVYASHDLTEQEATALAGAIRARPRFQAKELKSSGLRGRGDWPDIARFVTDATDGRANFIVTDKRLNLAARAVQYLIKPALQGALQIFHDHDVFRIGARLLDPQLREHLDLSRELNRFLTRFDLAAAPGFFELDPPFGCRPLVRATIEIARAHCAEIDAAVVRYRKDVDPTGVWTVDLALPSLHALLFDGWGGRFKTLDVVCDVSKPLFAFASHFEHRIGGDGSWEVDIGRVEARFEGALAGPLRFADSKTSDALQIADLLAGIALDLARGAFDRDRTELYDWGRRHRHPSAFVHYPAFRASTQPSRVAAGVLRALGDRAAAGRPLTEGLDALFAEQRKRYASPAARVGAPARGGREGIAPCPI